MHHDQADYLLALSAPELAAITHVDRTTAIRWKAGSSRIPFAAFALAQLAVDGMMPPAIAGGAWSGWRFGRDGRLYAPDVKRGYLPHHIRQLDILLPMFAWSNDLRRLVSSHLDELAGSALLPVNPDERRDRDREPEQLVIHGRRSP